MAASGQVYSCTLDYSVRAEGGRIPEWGSWSSLFSDGPGKAMARAHGDILIDTTPDASTPVRMFGKPSSFSWRVIQKGGGGGNGWVLFGQVHQELQGQGGSLWPAMISIQDYWHQGEAEFDPAAPVPITYFDWLNTLSTGLCRRV